jgi:TRAP-type C4-dicarboxylate transport system substrate-binding protein
MARKRGMTVVEAGRKRWEGVSEKERSALGREAAQARERQRHEREARQDGIEKAARFALKELEEVGAADEDGSRLSAGCLRAITKLREALA